MKKFKFEKNYDFIERTIQDYGFCCDMASAIVTYAEYAVRYKMDGMDDEAGLFMSSALTYAFMFTFTGAGRFYLYEVDKLDLNEFDRIIYCALKLVEAEFKDKPYEVSRPLLDDLIDAIDEYIDFKECDEENNSD